MGIIKRIVKDTSNKLLTALCVQRHSHNFELGSLAAPHQHQTASVKAAASPSSRRHGGSHKLTKRKAARQTIPDALHYAPKNYLPPVQFHHVHGQTAKLSNNKLVARRTHGFSQSLVFSNRVILPNERVYIKVLEIAKGWSGTIRFGFTSVDPATLKYNMPKHACPDMTNAGHTWARALADEVVRRNSVIHFSYNTEGYIHYGINNHDCGVFYANVNTSQHLWFIIDVYGLTAAVKLIDACLTQGGNSPTKPKSNTSSLTRNPSPPKSVKSQQSPRTQKTAQDNDENSPPTKDCPICFERPINCVLYQCGHMCTCYECGVKQWRGESRTCPICRTIIKDVIKTYMS